VLDRALARQLKLIGFDVDGVLTDNGIYLGTVGDHPVELKRFHIQDGLGLRMLKEAGLTVVFASARESTASELRGRELKVDEVLQNKKKLPTFEAMLSRRGIGWEETAFVGDDLPDLPLLRRAALPIAVANAVQEIKEAARVVTQRAGGQGAVREVAELILEARGQWQPLVKQYLTERGECRQGT
jgi:3-deoxy-D-manno-octulosonate 8-phosphate phosphatase (KDO 8-P phosphatase)